MMTIGYVGQMSMDPGSGVWCSSMKLSVASVITVYDIVDIKWQHAAPHDNQLMIDNDNRDSNT